MSFEFILPFLRPIEPSFHRTTRRIATGLAPRKELKTPSLPRTPSRLYRAPRPFCNRSSSADHAHSPLVAAWRDFGCGRGALVPTIDKAHSIVSTE